MAKRKKRKDNEEKESKHGFELTGLLWILISIIGFGGEEIFGPVGKIISNFCIFLSGSLWVVPLIFVFVFGAYGLIKNEKINMFSFKLCGLDLIIIGLLVFCHVNYVTRNNAMIMATFKSTIDSFLNVFGSNMYPTGGGIIGAIFSLLFVKLFSLFSTFFRKSIDFFRRYVRIYVTTNYGGYQNGIQDFR